MFTKPSSLLFVIILKTCPISGGTRDYAIWPMWKLFKVKKYHQIHICTYCVVCFHKFRHSSIEWMRKNIQLHIISQEESSQFHISQREVITFCNFVTLDTAQSVPKWIIKTWFSIILDEKNMPQWGNALILMLNGGNVCNLICTGWTERKDGSGTGFNSR